MYSPGVLFKDRMDAGRQLADRLAQLKLDNPVVYALPRGGVPLAVEISRRLNAPVDVVLVRKIGAPGSPEVALGAVTDGDHAVTVLNPDVARASGVTQRYLDRARGLELGEIERRRGLYLGGRERPDPTGRTVVIVDDGLATGATARAAAEALRRRGAGRILIAVPVAPPETVDSLDEVADEVICLKTPQPFGRVGRFYEDFHQLTDAEVIAFLREDPIRASYSPPTVSTTRGWVRLSSVVADWTWSIAIIISGRSNLKASRRSCCDRSPISARGRPKASGTRSTRGAGAIPMTQKANDGPSARSQTRSIGWWTIPIEVWLARFDVAAASRRRRRRSASSRGPTTCGSARVAMSLRAISKPRSV